MLPERLRNRLLHQALIYTEINFGVDNPISMPVGIHKAVGGDSDFPNPGDILCGAIAACLDTTIRIVANRVGVKLKELKVEVKGTVDVRGTLRVDDKVPVAFQNFDVAVSIKPAGFVPGMMLNKLLRAAEHSCVVIQSLRSGPDITVSRKRHDSANSCRTVLRGASGSDVTRLPGVICRHFGVPDRRKRAVKHL